MRLQVLQCDAAWDQMQSTEGGRHCDRCDRVVRDLTGMDEVGILRLLAREPELCGRVRSRPTARLGLSLAMLVLAGCTPWSVHEHLDVVEPTRWRNEPTVPDEPPEAWAHGEGTIGIGGLGSRGYHTTVGAMIGVAEIREAPPRLEAATASELPFALSGDVKINERRRPRRGHRPRRPD